MRFPLVGVYAAPILIASPRGTAQVSATSHSTTLRYPSRILESPAEAKQVEGGTMTLGDLRKALNAAPEVIESRPNRPSFSQAAKVDDHLTVSRQPLGAICLGQ